MVQGSACFFRDSGGGRRNLSILWLFLARVWGWLRAAWRALTAASGPLALATWSNIVQDVVRTRLAAPVWHARPCVLRGERRVAIVTGGNTGIGFETVRGLWLAGYHVVLACRSETRGEAARARLLSGPEKGKELADRGSLTVMPLDLSRLDAVVDFATLFRKHWNGLHILVLNAGIMSPGCYEETADGYEAHLGVNHLAQYLLVRLLEDLLRQSQGRVILVSSILALLADELRWHGAQWSKRGQWPFLAYGWSKAYNYICALELQRRGLDALCVHPGEVHTEVVRRLPSWLQRAYDFVGYWMLRTPAEGAATVLWACFAEISVSPEACHQGSKAAPNAASPYRSATVLLKSAERQALIADAGRRLLQMPSWMRAPSTGQQLWSLSEHAVQPYLSRTPRSQSDALTDCRHST